MPNHCYLVGISTDGNPELDDFYLVIAPSSHAAKERVQSKLSLNESAVVTAQWGGHIIGDRIWRQTGSAESISLEKEGMYPLHTISWA